MKKGILRSTNGKYVVFRIHRYNIVICLNLQKAVVKCLAI